MALRNRKGAIEVQFNWIFVMIAGSLILVFFFGVVQKQRELSDQKIANTLLTSLESIATGAGASIGTSQSVPMPKVGISFECSEECSCEYSISGVSKDYEDKLIFAPKAIEGREIVFWTLDWGVPFRVTNFLYATNPQSKYFFVSTAQSRASNFFKYINKTIPEKINADFIDFEEYTSVEDQNYVTSRFIFIDTPTPVMQSLHDSFRRADVGGVHMTPTGQLTFFDKTSARALQFSQSASAYYKEASLFGAVFAQDLNMYECNMIKALDRLAKIADIYQFRTGELNRQNEEGEAEFCPGGYNPQPFEALKTAAQGASNNLANIGNLQGPVTTLESLNQGHLRKSCPLIY